MSLTGKQAEAMAESSPGLKRALQLRDLVLLNIVAVYTPGTISQTIQMDRWGLLLWPLAGLSFMLPYATALARLSRQYPREGGIYAWTKLAFGDFHGFICGWCYWVNVFLYLPTIFLALASVAALIGGAQTAWLQENPTLITAIACGALWLAAWLHLVGLSKGKVIQNIGGYCRLAIALALVGAAAWSLTAGPSATPSGEVSLSE